MTLPQHNQQPDESYEEWKERLLDEFLSDDTCLTWIEVCLLLDLPWDENELLRNAEINQEVELDRQEELYNQEVELLQTKEWQALENKKDEIQKEKMILSDKKTEINRYLRKWARAENLLNEIKQACQEVAGTIPLKRLPSKENTNREGILLLSDWHVGQYSSNSWNTFNEVELRKRVSFVTERALHYARLNMVDKLHCFVLGDLINGLIHITTRINNQDQVIHQVILAAELLTQMFNEISKEIPVIAYFSRGNHDRVSPNKKESIDAESFFDLIPWYLKSRFNPQDTSVTLVDNEIDPEIIRAEILGHVCFGVHGHKDKPQQAAKRLATFLKEIPEFIFMGHYHSGLELDDNGTEIIVNSSLCGTDDFAVSLRRNSKAGQKLLILTPEGRECTYNINF